MTEPAPGGGSDPSMIKTEAVYKNGKWKVNGLKWYITGAAVASHFIPSQNKRWFDRVYIIKKINLDGI